MKTSAIAFLGLALMAGAAQAQCNCGATSYAAPVRMMPAPMAPAPMAPTTLPAPAMTVPAPTTGPASIKYINKLIDPVPRANYTLNYAIHLTDGRILLSDFLPSGYQTQGSEYAPGSQRRLQVSVDGGNSVTVRDPQSNSTVATFAR